MIKNEVYVAGDNLITSLGFTTDENIRAIENHTIGFRMINDDRLTSLPLPLSLVDSSGMEELFSEIQGKYHFPLDQENYTRMEKLFIISIANAIRQTGINIKGEKTLLVISSTKGNIDLLDDQNRDLFDPKRLYLWSLAEVIRRFFGFVHPPVIISNACISGVLAIGVAHRLILSGKFENAVVAGGDILSKFVISGFQSFQALSPEPCRPYDLNRTGLSLGEGCGTIVLTSNRGLVHDHPVTIAAMATSNDANHISGPSRTGEELALAIRDAIDQAGLTPASIDYISAHGTATPFNDEMESKALSLSLLNEVPVNSFKGYWGHTLGGAGVIESIAAIHSMKKNMLFRSAGFGSLGVPERISIIAGNSPKEIHHCLKTASGFGGCNAALVIRKMP